MKLVITATKEDFYDYCRDSGLDPQTRPRTVQFVESYEDFLDVDTADLILYNNWRESRIYQDPEMFRFMLEYGRLKRWRIPEI